MNNITKCYLFTIALGLSLFACVGSAAQVPVYDPYETLNRKIFVFNQSFDKTIAKPVARVYRSILPIFVREGVSNFFNNIAMLPTTANNLLQGEMTQAIKSTWRFVINSSLGVFGLFDVASHFGLEPHYQDLGLTLAKWGDKRSPYLVIPILGSSSIRDIFGMSYDYALFTPYPYIRPTYDNYALQALYYLSLRADFLEAENIINQVSFDAYTFQRDAYWQRRNSLIGSEHSNDTIDYIVEDPVIPTTTFTQQVVSSKHKAPKVKHEVTNNKK